MHSKSPSGQPPTLSPLCQRARTQLRLTLAGALTLALVLCAAVGIALAQNAAPPERNPAAENLTQNLVALNARYHRANPAAQARLLSDLLTVAADRQQFLTALIENDPGEVLRVALPAAIRANLPPRVQTYIEREEEIEGELEVQVEDRDDGHRYHYFLNAVEKRLSLHFATDPPTDLLTGSHVRVKGVQVDSALALSSGNTSVQALAQTALPNTFGAQKTLVILVNFQDKATQPYTLATAQSVVFNTTSNFDLENSFQQTWLTGDVYGWFTIPMSYTVCDSATLANYAKQAATAAGVNLSAYTRYVYAFPDNACSWWGLGTVGGNPSQAWINGSLQVKVVAHEMGHNFGLYHSNAWECGTSTLGTSCSSIEYGNTLDTMGNPTSGHFNAFQKERLGWLNYGASPLITTVQTGGVYSLDPYESPSSDPKALKILKSTDPTTGKSTWYYVEYRRAIGFDNFLSTNSNVLNGVVVHTGAESTGNSSYLLDMTPTTSSWSDPALDVGQSFYDPDSQVTITPMSVGSTGATISVSFGSLACVPANPTVTLSPSATQWVQPGASATYTVTVTNNDNTGCTTSGFNLQASVPSGWTATFASSMLILSPGTSVSTALTVTSPVTAAQGFYDIGITATNSEEATYAASTSVTINLSQGLIVAVSTSQSLYSRGKTVPITATVTAGGSPVANASVTFSITKANGAVVTGTATTGTNGTAVYNFRTKKPDPVGTYTVTVNASTNNVAGSSSTTFTVQ